MTEIVRCKWCGSNFFSFEGFTNHLERKKNANDPYHPKYAEAQTSSLRISHIDDIGILQYADDFQERMYEYQLRGPFQDGLPGRRESVSVAELEDLIDSFRMREGQAGGFYQAATELQELIEDHSPKDNRQSTR